MIGEHTLVMPTQNGQGYEERLVTGRLPPEFKIMILHSPENSEVSHVDLINESLIRWGNAAPLLGQHNPDIAARLAVFGCQIDATVKDNVLYVEEAVAGLAQVGRSARRSIGRLCCAME